MCAQKNNTDSVPNNDSKCVSFTFDYDEPVNFIEVDCATMETKSREITKEMFIEIEQRRLKMIAYQEKLKNLGYDVDITGRVDPKIIKAHSIYLKK